MERRVNYLLVGVFSLLMVAGIIVFVLWAHYRGNSRPTASYNIYFSQAVNGLSLGSPVRYLGVDAGHVEGIDLDTNSTPPRVHLIAAIDASIPITQGTIASIKPSGITGVSFIDLHADAANAAPLSQTAGSLPTITSESSSLDQLFDSASDSAKRVDLLLSNENLQLIHNTLASLDHISAKIDAILAAHGNALGKDIDELGDTLRSAHKTLDSVGDLSKSIKDDPSQLIFPSSPKGVKVAP